MEAGHQPAADHPWDSYRFGISGSIFAHCSSVRSTTCLLTGLASGESNIPIFMKKQAFKSFVISRA